MLVTTILAKVMNWRYANSRQGGNAIANLTLAKEFLLMKNPLKVFMLNHIAAKFVQYKMSAIPYTICSVSIGGRCPSKFN